MLGRVLHVVVDAMLISMVLSGIKRNTGLTVALPRIKHLEMRKFVSAYLEAGEWLMDFAVVCLGRSSSFERIR
ncbi:fungal protein of unknown function (DUF1748) [Malassezia restricta]|uniref:DUF1748-domain-containing protein n=1 Tax=Malassezia restricta (strain ATCC 96810 / NBRC 103918 / CBS 7877) TaxID=425264 RepID=A0A3G2SA06_MALR7|nr:fungal protein of unknown function (DUF1748) [Malassezia restricta]AXA51577.1 fungal protein of unknown function (DUF1748) [Malassezia restricta]AYO44162.1 uncharacterized protein DNF11_3212 [Malassezia restricta CBS 7877]